MKYKKKDLLIDGFKASKALAKNIQHHFIVIHLKN